MNCKTELISPVSIIPELTVFFGNSLYINIALQVKQCSVYQYDAFVPLVDKPVDSSWKSVENDKYALSQGIIRY